jgi:hypothetical protein
VVEDDDLLALGCSSFCRGLLSSLWDDDIGLRRSSWAMVVLGCSRCFWSFVFVFLCACKGQQLCIFPWYECREILKKKERVFSDYLKWKTWWK